mgnify:CR=1 FL=1
MTTKNYWKLLMAALVMCLPFAMTACSSDDDDDEPVEVTYTWSWVVDYSTTGMTASEKAELAQYENVLIKQYGQRLVGNVNGLFKQQNLHEDSYVVVTTEDIDVTAMNKVAVNQLTVLKLDPNNAEQEAIDHLPSGVSMTVFFQKNDGKKQALSDPVVLK